MLEILPDSDSQMRKTSRRVKHVDEVLRDLVADMYDTMVANWGIGLAAIQVGVPKRLFMYEIPVSGFQGYENCYQKGAADTADESNAAKDATEQSSADDLNEENRNDNEPGEEEPEMEYTGDYTVCINPRIISREGAIIDAEGCLSKAGWVAKVERAYEITFQAYDLDMKKFERTVTGLEARCVQHEIDHLDGILFTDRAQPGSLREITEDEEEEEEVETVALDSNEEPVEITTEDSSVGS